MKRIVIVPFGDIKNLMRAVSSILVNVSKKDPLEIVAVKWSDLNCKDIDSECEQIEKLTIIDASTSFRKSPSISRNIAIKYVNDKYKCRDIVVSFLDEDDAYLPDYNAINVHVTGELSLTLTQPLVFTHLHGLRRIKKQKIPTNNLLRVINWSGATSNIHIHKSKNADIPFFAQVLAFEDFDYVVRFVEDYGPDAINIVKSTTWVKFDDTNPTSVSKSFLNLYGGWLDVFQAYRFNNSCLRRSKSYLFLLFAARSLPYNRKLSIIYSLASLFLFPNKRAILIAICSATPRTLLNFITKEYFNAKY